MKKETIERLFRIINKYDRRFFDSQEFKELVIEENGLKDKRNIKGSVFSHMCQEFIRSLASKECFAIINEIGIRSNNLVSLFLLYSFMFSNKIFCSDSKIFDIIFSNSDVNKIKNIIENDLNTNQIIDICKVIYPEWLEMFFSQSDILEILTKKEIDIESRMIIAERCLRSQDAIYSFLAKKKGYNEFQKLKILINNPNVDIAFLIKCLRDKKLGLRIMKENDINEIEKFVEIINHKKYSVEGNTIKLPRNMMIGIEIESEGLYSLIIGKIISNLNKGWVGVEDSTLDNGIEIKTEEGFTSENKDKIHELEEICRFQNKLGQSVSENCGGHIHIGANYLTTKESWMNLLQLWANNEKILYTISNPPGEIPRITIPIYATPYSKKLEQKLKTKEFKLDTKESVIELAKSVQDESRHYGINFENVGSKDKNTIEFRLSNGTIDSKTWIENINLYGGIVKAAEDIARIQNKSPQEWTEEEKEKLEIFEKLNSDEINDKERLENLLHLIMLEEDKNIYRRRFIDNNKLLEREFEKKMKKYIKSQTARKKIVLTPSLIGNSFLGSEDENRIQGPEFYENARFLAGEIEHSTAELNR